MTHQKSKIPNIIPLFSLSLMPFFTFMFMMLSLNSCAISRPCSDLGDTHWYPPLKGNMKCTTYQFNKNGKKEERLEGKFYQYNLEHRLVLEGQYKNGLKSGWWYQYDDQGNKIVSKFFKDGIESPVVLPSP